MMGECDTPALANVHFRLTKHPSLIRACPSLPARLINFRFFQYPPNSRSSHLSLQMAPTAVFVTPVASLNDQKVSPAPLKGAALAIGSPNTAEDGKYQSLVSSLETTRKVERYMLDRLLDGG